MAVVIGFAALELLQAMQFTNGRIGVGQLALLF
jgi:hypothetical protein